jgi:hypothetical protein
MGSGNLLRAAGNRRNSEARVPGESSNLHDRAVGDHDVGIRGVGCTFDYAKRFPNSERVKALGLKPLYNLVRMRNLLPAPV